MEDKYSQSAQTIRYLQDELNEARTALAIKKNALQRANLKIDELKSDISDIKHELDKLKRESAEMFEDFSSLLSASSELIQYLDPLEAEEAMRMLEDRGFDVKAKYEITVRKNQYWSAVEPIYDPECKWELKWKVD